MIKNRNELKIGKLLVNEMRHFKHTYEISDIDDKYIYTTRGCCMPIDFYLNKPQFKVEDKPTKGNLYYISDRDLSLILDGLAFYQADMDEFKDIEGNIETYNELDKLMTTLNLDFNKQKKEN